jgi:hypothetical protein
MYSRRNAPWVAARQLCTTSSSSSRCTEHVLCVCVCVREREREREWHIVPFGNTADTRDNFWVSGGTTFGFQFYAQIWVLLLRSRIQG